MNEPHNFIKLATYDEDHKALVNLMKKSPFTRSFGSHIFSSPEHYRKGWIEKYVHVDAEGNARILGAHCIRHKTREPVTKLYFIIVDPEARGHAIGTTLLNHIRETSPHGRIELDVSRDNGDARRWYEREGFSIVKENKIGYAMEWSR